MVVNVPSIYECDTPLYRKRARHTHLPLHGIPTHTDKRTVLHHFPQDRLNHTDQQCRKIYLNTIGAWKFAHVPKFYCLVFAVRDEVVSITLEGTRKVVWGKNVKQAVFTWREKTNVRIWRDNQTALKMCKGILALLGINTRLHEIESTLSKSKFSGVRVLQYLVGT